MNDTATKPTTHTLSDTLRAYRRAQALKHEIFRAYRPIDLSGAGQVGGAMLECEIEFYRESDAIPATSDSPGEPAQYAIASVTAVEYGLDPGGFTSTTPTPMPTPAWLEDLLIECIDEDSLSEDAQ